MHYTYIFSSTTDRGTIHASTCSVAIAGHRKGRRLNAFDMEAASAQDLRAQIIVDEQLQDRGLPLPVICKCAR